MLIALYITASLSGQCKGTSTNIGLSCGGVCVLPGDIIVGDDDGVIVVPLRHLHGILARVRKVAETERSGHGMKTGGREQFADFFDKAFASRVAPPLSEG